jgi:transcriptional regulator with XRE-family HTH domain
MRKGEVTVRGRAIAAFRRKDGMSQLALAEKATERLRSSTGDDTRSISESLVALVETGRRQPSRENGEAIASALGIPFDAIGDVTVFEDEVA